MKYPELNHEQLQKLPPMVREVILSERKMEPFKSAQVLTLSDCRIYKELIGERNRFVSACNNTYGKVSNDQGNGPRFA